MTDQEQSATIELRGWLVPLHTGRAFVVSAPDDTRHPYWSIGVADLPIVVDGGDGSMIPIVALVFTIPSTAPAALVPRKLAPFILESRVMTCVDGLGEIDAAERTATHRAGLATLTSVIPSYTCGRSALGTLDDTVHATLIGESQALAIRDLQRIADATYGRLEWERAIAWALEELGELAQAKRQNHGAVRIAEEVGQLFNWALCLANIAGVDLARASAAAIDTERDRQIAKYGEMRPYRGNGAPT